MDLLKNRILTDGKAVNEHVLKVDSFINHQVDPMLMDAIGKELFNHYKNQNITKVVTVESSGIAPAVLTALYLNVPLIILKKRNSKTLIDDIYQTKVKSFTKNTEYDLTLSKKYLNENDNVLVIDDFLANGEASIGAIKLIEMSGAKVVSIAILIEKSFQEGRKKLEQAGYDIYSLARISKLSDGKIEFLD